MTGNDMGLGEDDLYGVLSGRDPPRTVEELATIAHASATLADYHTWRRATLSA